MVPMSALNVAAVSPSTIHLEKITVGLNVIINVICSGDVLIQWYNSLVIDYLV